MRTTAPEGRQHLKKNRKLQVDVARFLLTDGNRVGAEVSPEGLEVFTYID